MGKMKCPKCGSTDLYNEVSVMARQRVNGKSKRIYNIDTGALDNIYELVFCNKCGYEIRPNWLLSAP